MAGHSARAAWSVLLRSARRGDHRRGARLLLALLEHEVSSLGGHFAACDTDSLFVCATEDGRPPDGLERLRFLSWGEVETIRRKFERLNPYDRTAVPEILKAEHGGMESELWFFGVSSKRYVLYRPREGGPEVVDFPEGRDEEPLSDDLLDLVKPSEHGLGHLQNPIDPDDESRDWIKEAWRYLLALDQGPPVKEPDWLDAPAVAQVAISTPRLLDAFSTWNGRRRYPESVKPFGFMLVAYARPRSAGQRESLRLVHPFEWDRRKLLTTEWADLYHPERRHRIATVGPDAIGPEPGMIVVKSYRDALIDYLGHPEAKSVGPDGRPCQRRTRGLLTRRPLEAISVVHIGKESNLLEDRLAGLVASEAAARVARVSGMPASTVADIFAKRTEPRRGNRRTLVEAAFELSGEWLESRGLTSAPDINQRLATFLDLHTAWRGEVAIRYETALRRMATMAQDHRGIVGRVAQQARVSRRKLRALKDSQLQEAVARAVDAAGSTTDPHERRR